MSSSYKILVGVNLKLEEGEIWNEVQYGGRIIQSGDGQREVRFEPGEIAKGFPAITDIDSLVSIHAIEKIRVKR